MKFFTRLSANVTAKPIGIVNKLCINEKSSDTNPTHGMSIKIYRQRYADSGEPAVFATRTPSATNAYAHCSTIELIVTLRCRVARRLRVRQSIVRVQTKADCYRYRSQRPKRRHGVRKKKKKKNPVSTFKYVCFGPFFVRTSPRQLVYRRGISVAPARMVATRAQISGALKSLKIKSNSV
jgi:hypothetical protein